MWVSRRLGRVLGISGDRGASRAADRVSIDFGKWERIAIRRAHKRVNPGNRSCRGSMLRPSFDFRSTKQQYMKLIVVPARLCLLHDISVHRSVDKFVGIARDSRRLAKKGAPTSSSLDRAPPASDSMIPRHRHGQIRELMPASAPETRNLPVRSNGARTHSPDNCS